jgi:hypothetical protein
MSNSGSARRGSPDRARKRGGPREQAHPAVGLGHSRDRLDVDPLSGYGIPARVAAGEDAAIDIAELANSHAGERLSIRRKLELMP